MQFDQAELPPKLSQQKEDMTIFIYRTYSEIISELIRHLVELAYSNFCFPTEKCFSSL